MVEQLDRWLGKYFTAMRKLPVFPKLNFIITSDHGMGSISNEKQIILDNWIDTNAKMEKVPIMATHGLNAKLMNKYYDSGY